MSDADSPAVEMTLRRAILCLLGILLVSAGVRLWIIAHTAVAARDSIGFIRLALYLNEPPTGQDRRTVLRKAEHPPGYSVALALIAEPIRAVCGTTAESMVLAAQLTSALAGLLLLVPMFLLGCLLFSRAVGVGAAALSQFTPTLMLHTTDGLSEGVYLLAAASALTLGTWTVQRPTARRCFLAGWAAGTAYLVRPEGMIFAGALGLMLPLLWRQGKISFARLIACGTTLTLGVALTAGPYMVAIGGITNKPTGRGLLRFLSGEELAPTWNQVPTSNAGPIRLFAAFRTLDDPLPKPVWVALEMTRETLKTTFYVLPALAVAGLIVIRRRGEFTTAHGLPLLVCLLFAGLLGLLALKIEYISERHCLIFMLPIALWAAVGLPEVIALIAPRPRAGRRILIAWGVILGVMIGGSLKSLHANRCWHRLAGEWLRANMEPGAILVDPFCWAEYYARGPGTEPNHEPTGKPYYIILEPKRPGEAEPHSRLPVLPIARTMAETGRPVQHWPEGPIENAKLIVYKLVPPRVAPVPDRSDEKRPPLADR